MSIWQADFYRRPLQDESGKPVWELVVCDESGSFRASAFCSQADVNSAWITQQLQILAPDRANLPKIIQVFRPQSVSLLQAACQPLGIVVEPTRHTPALKQVLIERAKEYPTFPNYIGQTTGQLTGQPTGQAYDPIALERPAPMPLPETLWGDRWRFAAIAAQDLLPAFQHRPIPIVDMPESLFPLNLQLPSSLPIPGVIIDGGRQSMQLARWLQRAKPVSLNYIPGEPDGLILEAGLVERWVLTTFDDRDMIAAARTFRERQYSAKGLHFLLVQPDDSGMTYTGFWLLQAS